jgi:hypothetical protein
VHTNERMLILLGYTKCSTIAAAREKMSEMNETKRMRCKHTAKRPEKSVQRVYTRLRKIRMSNRGSFELIVKLSRKESQRRKRSITREETSRGMKLLRPRVSQDRSIVRK